MSNSTALIVIDMQNGFLGEKSRHVIPSVLELVQQFKSRGLPIVFTRFHNEPNSQYEKLIGWKRLRSSPETELTKELVPYAELVVDKEIYSAFTPNFAETVREKGWNTLIVCGVATDGCVLKTAVDAFERGLLPIVVEDACSSHAGAEVHQAGLMLIGRFIGKAQVMKTQAVLSKLDASASSATIAT